MKIAVIIPCFKVRKHISEVINKIGDEVSNIYIVDDACPEKTGDFVKEHFSDSRISVITHNLNQGVGASVISGYKAAMLDGCEILVKLDGDGQMDPVNIYKITNLIISGKADYCKGNRFFYPSDSDEMPILRLMGNLGLSFITKAATGYWQIFDPTNGYTAIHSALINKISVDKLSKRYFFESDILFRLALIRAKVVDIPIKAIYNNEVSNLNEFKVFFEFLFKNIKNCIKRIIYMYFIRDFTFPSIQLLLGIILFMWGLIFGVFNWYNSYNTGLEATAGTVMTAALPFLMGFQLILSFLSADIAYCPKDPIHLNF